MPSIRIDTGINTKNAIARARELGNEIRKALNSGGDKSSAVLGVEVQMKKLLEDTAKLVAQMEDFSKQKLPTQEYAQLSKELEIASAQLAKLDKQSTKMGEITQEYSQVEKALEHRKKVLEDTTAEYERLKKIRESAEFKNMSWVDTSKINNEFHTAYNKMLSARDILMNTQRQLSDPKFFPLLAHNAEIDKTVARIKEIKAVMTEMEQNGTAMVAGKNTQAFEDMKMQLDLMTDKLTQLGVKREEILQKEKATQDAIAQKEQDRAEKEREATLQYEQKVRYAIEEAQEKERQAQQRNAERESIKAQREEARRITEEYRAQTRELAQHKQLLQGIQGILRGFRQMINGFVTSIRTAVGYVRTAFNYVNRLRRAIFSTHKETQHSLRDTGASLKSGLKTILQYTIGIASIASVFSLLKKTFKEGFSNMVGANVHNLKNEVNELKASVLTLKNAFASAFEPIVQIAIPYIKQLLDWVITLMNYLGQFIASFTGGKWVKAVKQTASSVAGAGKAMQQALSPLDKLNVISSNKGGGAGATNYAGMFTEGEIEPWIKELADKIKNIAKDLFDPIKKAWDKVGDYVIKSWKGVWTTIKGFVGDFAEDFMVVWKQPKTQQIFENVLLILGDIGGAIDGIIRQVRNAWNTGDKGLRILENIRNMVLIITDSFHNMSSSIKDWASNLDFNPLMTKFEGLTKSLTTDKNGKGSPLSNMMGMLEDFLDNVLEPLGKWVIEDAGPQILAWVNRLVNEIDWAKLRENLNKLWEALQKFGGKIWENLQEKMGGFIDKIVEFVNDGKLDEWIQKFSDWVDNLTQEDINNALDNIKDIVENLGKLFGAVMAWRVVSPVVTGIGSFITAILRFAGTANSIKRMNELAQALKDLKDAQAGAPTAGASAPTSNLSAGAQAHGAVDSYTNVAGGAMLVGTYATFVEGQALAKQTEEAEKNLKRLQEATNAYNSGDLATAKKIVDELGLSWETFELNVTASGTKTGVLCDKVVNLNANLENTDRDLSDLDKTKPFSVLGDDVDKFSDSLRTAEVETDNLADSASVLQTSWTDKVSKGLGDVKDNVVKFNLDLADAEEYWWENEVVPWWNDTGVGQFVAIFQSPTWKEDIKGAFKMWGDDVTTWWDTEVVPWWNGTGIGQFVNVFKASTWKEDIKGAFKLWGEDVNNWWNTSVVPWWQSTGIAKFVDNFKQDGWKQNIRTAFSNLWDDVERGWETFTTTIQRGLSSLWDDLRGIDRELSANTNSKATGNWRYRGAKNGAVIYPHVNRMASGGVVPPTMAEHLVMVGDNKSETEVISPLSTMRQAMIEALSSAGMGGGAQEIVINLDGREIMRALVKQNAEYKKQHNGASAFA